MKPPIGNVVVPTDVLFVMLAAVFAVEVLLGRARFQWRRAYWILAAYLVGLAASLMTSSDPQATSFKLATQLYLMGLVVLTDQLIDEERDIARLCLAWLAGTAVVALLAVASLLVFPFAPDGALLNFTRFHFGTLPPGDYPRLAVTFFDANMLCNYLTASLGLLLIAAHRQWISRPLFGLLLAGILVAALSTISPGLGGIALCLGLWFWILRRTASPAVSRLGLWCGIGTAVAFVAAAAVTPILHSTAPFLIRVPGADWVLAPSGRFLAWSAAMREFGQQPLLGHGLGTYPVQVPYADPSGVLQNISDAHNTVLNIAVQCGLAGLAGLALVIAYAVRLSWPWRWEPGSPNLLRLGIGLTFLNAMIYQGLTASFEDARHLWVLFGMLIASERLTRRDAALSQ